MELAVDPLPHRQTISLNFRVFCGVSDDPMEQTGIGGIVERTLSKGTRRYGGQELADAFDKLGAQWSSVCGRQSTLVRAVCLPEFTLPVVDLVAEMIARPTFPDESCEVAVKLSIEELQHLEDDPQSLLTLGMQRAALGPVFGRNPAGEAATLARITPSDVRGHWKKMYQPGRTQLSAAGPIDAEALAAGVERAFAGMGRSEFAGREPARFEFVPQRVHRERDLKQQYIGLSLEGAAKGTPDYAVEQLMIGVLSGGMSARLFTEVREKQGLVYWVGAWHEQPRGRGIIHLGASTTPERCDATFTTLLRELARLSEDLTDEETSRARNSLIAHASTEDDLTAARAAGLSDDLFHFSRPVGMGPKLDALAAVTTRQVAEYAARLKRDRLCVVTIGPRGL